MVNLVVTAGPQVFDAVWAKGLSVERVDIGTGMTDAEVTDLGGRLDLAAARAYRSAVGRRTREAVTALPAAAWAERMWPGVTRANRLGATAIAHNAMHLGEAVAIRGQLGLGVGM